MVFLFIGLACQPLSAQSISELPVEWKPLREGVTSIQIGRFELTEPRPIKGVVAKIDLTKPLEIVITPSNGDKAKETVGMTVESFLSELHCDLAINAGPFQPVLVFEKGMHDVAGMQVAGGVVVSPGDVERPILAFDEGNRPTIYGAKKLPAADSVHNAVPGFHVVVKDGKPQGQQKPLHPRTAAGYSKDGNTLWLLVVDGRQTGKSEGVTTLEVGQMLVALGADSGINLDGGGSSTMVIRNEDGEPQVLNLPINAGIAGAQRSVGSHFGIRFPKE